MLSNLLIDFKSLIEENLYLVIVLGVIAVLIVALAIVLIVLSVKAKKIAPAFAERRFGSGEYRTLSPLMRESYKKIVNEDLREDASKIDCPVLFLHGAEDREVPLSSIGIYLSRVRGSELRLLEGCGHFAHLENPVAFNLAAEEFLLC